jgi:hypothetical protein
MPGFMDINPPAAQVAQAVVISENWAQSGASPALPKPEKAAGPVTEETGNAPATKPPIELADPRIKRAVAAMVAETPDRSSVPANQHDAVRRPVYGADTPDQYKQFAKDFADAKLPSCLGNNGLKFQPPKIGQVVLGGLLALPFVVAAKVGGKCK